MRVLIKNVNSLAGVLAVRNVLVSLTFFVDYFLGLGVVSANFIRLGTFFFTFKGFYFLPTISNLLSGSTKLLHGLDSVVFVAEFLNDGNALYTKVKKS